MRSRRQMRLDGFRVLRKQYFMFVIIYAAVMMLGNLFSSAGGLTVRKMSEKSKNVPGIDRVFEMILNPDNTSYREGVSLGGSITGSSGPNIIIGSREPQTEVDNSFWESMLDRKEGVFAAVLNSVRTGSLIDSFAGGIEGILGSNKVSTVVLILVASSILFVLWFFIKNITDVVAYRLFLEGRCYDSVNLSHSLFLIRVKEWTHVAWVMFVTFVYRVLWFLTIVGGVIKSYSYFMVPFILAENPKTPTKEAITLSRKMMQGHKLRCFVLQLSYLLWFLPFALVAALLEPLHPVLRASVSFGSLVFLLGPLFMTGYCEFAAEIRKLALEKNIEGSEYLVDHALFARPTNECLKEAYMDVLEQEAKPGKSLKLSGFSKIMADWFGITFWHSKRERAYEEHRTRLNQIRVLSREANGELYPTRMSPHPTEKHWALSDNIHYMRHYSVWSLVLIFFTFGMVGWFWEVVMHLVQTGEYANRGVMAGPWLPIYGVGSVMALVLLNKFRAHPALEFGMSILMCGVVEYFTGYFLELKNGMRWWDYSDYVLNLHGRICAEGLLVFGIGCVAAVYVLAPLLDSLFRRMPRQLLVLICMVLTFAFCVDEAYSNRHPNTGKGVTTAAEASDTSQAGPETE